LNLHQFLAQFEIITGLKPPVAQSEAYFATLLAAAAQPRL